MPLNPLWQRDFESGWNDALEFLRLSKVPHVDRVHNQEREAGDGGDPDRQPRNMDGNTAPPGIRGPLCNLLQDVHLASSTPPIARFTRLRISGIL